MQTVVTLDKALAYRQQGALFVDVRSPAEFAETTIPGAVNVPIFSNEERAEVGTLFKQVSRQSARKRGIEIISPRIPQMIEQVEAERRVGSPPVVVFCWRGGTRSLAMTAFLRLAGIPAQQLVGGHKAFRCRVVDFFAHADFDPVYVVRGLTGTGKTLLLRKLSAQGYPVIDLEQLANHRGSAFGGLGLGNQPGQKLFEARLWDRLSACREADYLLTEGESRHIGRLVVPPRFHLAMQQQTSLWVDASLEYRTRVILNDYPALDDLTPAFEMPILALKERLGKTAVTRLLALLHQKDWRELTRCLMVDYYDPLYMHTCPIRRVSLRVEELEQGVEDLKRALETLRRG